MADLNGSGTEGEHARAVAAGQPGKIDQNVNFHAAQTAGGLAVAHGVNIDAVFTRAFNSRAHLASMASAERYQSNLEAGLVMALEDAGHLRRDRIESKFRREIADPHPPVLVLFPIPQRGRSGRKLVLHPHLGTSQLDFRRIADDDVDDRASCSLSGADGGAKRCTFLFNAAPIAAIHLALEN